MSQTERNEKWIAYKRAPSNICMNWLAMQYNHFEFIISSDHFLEENGKEGIRKYNLHSNQWDEVITFTDDLFEMMDAKIALISKTNKLYLMNNDKYSKQQKMLILDMKTKQLSTRNSISNALNSAFVNVNGIIHVIGGSNNSKHLTWNPDDNEIKEIYDFAPEFHFQDLQWGRSIYVPSKDVLLLIGAYCEKDGSLGPGIGIWRFHLKLNKWECMINGSDFAYRKVSAALSSNENYVIIACGYLAGFYDDKIYVLDIRNEEEYKLNECAIRSPQRCVSNIVMTGGIKDEYLVVGWIKELFKTLEFKQLALPPMYIMELIAKWYNEEEVHWVRMVYGEGYNGNSHFAIGLKHIVSSLTK